jgi:hypothetical protein
VRFKMKKNSNINFSRRHIQGKSSQKRAQSP